MTDKQLNNILAAPEDREHCPECNSIDCDFNREHGFWTCNSCEHNWGYDEDDPDYEEADDEEPTYQKYRGYSISIYPEYEPTESRLARGDWKSRIIGYRYTIKYREGLKVAAEAEGFPSVEIALQDAENRIDAMIDSL